MVIKKRNLKIIPPISKKPPKYADHPLNDGHGFAALRRGFLGRNSGVQELSLTIPIFYFSFYAELNLL